MRVNLLKTPLCGAGVRLFTGRFWRDALEGLGARWGRTLPAAFSAAARVATVAFFNLWKSVSFSVIRFCLGREDITEGASGDWREGGDGGGDWRKGGRMNDECPHG